MSGHSSDPAQMHQRQQPVVLNQAKHDPVLLVDGVQEEDVGHQTQGCHNSGEDPVVSENQVDELHVLHSSTILLQCSWWSHTSTVYCAALQRVTVRQLVFSEQKTRARPTMTEVSSVVSDNIRGARLGLVPLTS